MKKSIVACVSLILMAVLHANASGQIENSANQSSAPSRFEASADQAARTQQALENIEKAITVLIPGGIKEGSPRKKQFAAVIDSFIKGNARDTMEALKKMAAEDPNLPPAEVMMAGLTFAVGDSKSGTVLLESSAVKHPDYPGVYLSFAQIAINTNRITDASLHADKTARLLESGNLSPERKKHFLKQYYEVATNIYLRRKKNQKANETLEQLQALSPNLPFYYFSKAELAFRDGNNDVALQNLKQHATAIQSKRIPELTLVDWLKNTGKDGQAQDLLLKTRQQNPKDAATQLMAAQMFMAKEDFENSLKAIQAFEEANGGESKQSLDMKGRIAFAGLSYDVAAGHFSKLAPSDTSSANILALCLIESDDPAKRQQAKQISQQIASRLTSNMLAIGSLAYIYLKSGEKEKSKQLMQRVILSRQATPEISFFVANSLIDSGQKEEAAGILKQALNSKSLFLYRSASRKLLTSLESQQ